jgi:hypothetical protein
MKQFLVKILFFTFAVYCLGMDDCSGAHSDKDAEPVTGIADRPVARADPSLLGTLNEGENKPRNRSVCAGFFCSPPMRGILAEFPWNKIGGVLASYGIYKISEAFPTITSSVVAFIGGLIIYQIIPEG